MFFLVKYLIRAWRRRQDSPAGRELTMPAPSPAAARGPLALLVHQVRYDLRASLRNPRARFFTFFFPILLLVDLQRRVRQRHDDDRRRAREALALLRARHPRDVDRRRRLRRPRHLDLDAARDRRAQAPPRDARCRRRC